MSREQQETALSTADLVSAGEQAQARQQTRAVVPVEDARRESTEDSRPEEGGRPEPSSEDTSVRAESEPLAALFDPELSHDFRASWSTVQIGFVDDPRRAVQQADELVAQVMKSLAESFARQRAEIEAGVNAGEQASTEGLRLALRRYRSFFERLLAL